MNSVQAQGVIKERNVRIGHFGSTCESPIYVAYEKGFWKAEGLNVELIKGTIDTLKDALATKKIDGTDGVLMSWLKPAEQGLDIKFTGGLHTGCQQVIVPKNSPIRSIKDIKGKVIGVTAIGGGGMNILERELVRYHINPQKDVTWKVYPMAEMALVMGKGQVDLCVLGDPFGQIIVDKGQGRSLLNTATSQDYKNEYCCLVVINGQEIRTDPAAAVAITHGLLNASKWVAEHPEETAKLIVEKKYVPGTVEENLRIIRTYNYHPSIAGCRDAIVAAAYESKRCGILDPGTDPHALSKNLFVWLKGLREVR